MPCHPCAEDITNPSYRLDKAGEAGGTLDFAPQPCNLCVNGAVESFEVTVPRQIHKQFTLKDATRVLHEHTVHIELTGRQQSSFRQ